MDDFNTLYKRIVIRDMKQLDKISMKFFFKNQKCGRDPTDIIFAKQDSIVVLNIDTEEVFVMCKFTTPLSK